MTAEQVEDVVVATLESTPTNATHWSRAKMAQRTGLSKSTIGRIWKAFDLKPHRADGFKLSNDPLFVEKVYDVVGLYLDPPEAAVVLCVDEKSQVQALARSQPAFPMMPGMPEKRTHDYVRHGTTSLFAAFNIADGTVISSTHRRHRATEFRKFLTKIDTEVPEDLDVHLVCDNYATHKHPTITAWLDRPTPGSTCTSPRPTPPGSTRSNGSSPSSPPTCSNAPTIAASRPSKPTSDAGSRTGTRTPKPFVWTKTAEQILESLRQTSSTNYWRRTLGEADRQHDLVTAQEPRRPRRVEAGPPQGPVRLPPGCSNVRAQCRRLPAERTGRPAAGEA